MKIRNLIVLTVALIAGSVTANAQGKSMKIAHINSTELMESVPEVDSITKKLEATQKKYQKMLTAIEKEVQAKQEFWQAVPATDSITLQLRQKEYETLVTSYQQTETLGQQAMAKMQKELYEPLFDKLKELIKTVAQEQGYSYVIDSSEGSGVIFGDPAHDLMDAVKERLKTTKL
jgi:outer membrane protein